MMSIRFNQLLLSLLFVGILFSVSNCSSDESDETEADIFWKEARLNDFPLFELYLLEPAKQLRVILPRDSGKNVVAGGV